MVEAASHHLNVGRSVALRSRNLSMTEPSLNGEQIDA